MRALREAYLATKESSKPILTTSLRVRHIFGVTPKVSVDNKAISKAAVSTQFLGHGSPGTSTKLYADQAGSRANTGKYSSDDVIFVSINGIKRKGVDPSVHKELQDLTIRESLKALERGATLITDSRIYTKSSKYNEGEKRLAQNLEHKGMRYREGIIEDEVVGTWVKPREDFSIPDPVGKPSYMAGNTEVHNYELNRILSIKPIDIEIPSFEDYKCDK